MKRFLLFAALFSAVSATCFAQIDAATAAKRERRKNLMIKEWNTDAKTKTRWLDRTTVYDAEGRKIEETEYASYGQKWRETYEYGENGRVEKEVQYDDRNKPKRVVRYEYNSDGTKKRQYNYAPNGKLETVKVFEYITTEE